MFYSKVSTCMSVMSGHVVRYSSHSLIHSLAHLLVQSVNQHVQNINIKHIDLNTQIYLHLPQSLTHNYIYSCILTLIQSQYNLIYIYANRFRMVFEWMWTKSVSLLKDWSICVSVAIRAENYMQILKTYALLNAFYY